MDLRFFYFVTRGRLDCIVLSGGSSSLLRCGEVYVIGGEADEVEQEGGKDDSKFVLLPQYTQPTALRANRRIGPDTLALHATRRAELFLIGS